MKVIPLHFIKVQIWILTCIVLFFTRSEAQNPASVTINVGLATRNGLSSSWLGYNGSNFTRNNNSWANANVRANVPNLKAKTLRYPAGGTGNFWDWKIGWFKNFPGLPQEYKNLPKLPDKLEDFKVVLDSSHADCMYMLNMVCENL